MTPPLRRTLLVFVLPLAYFAVRLTLALQAHGDTINPDAVSYLRHALYWTEGRFGDAVAGYWSPLLSWGTALGILLGFDPLHAAYTVVALGGLTFVVLCGVAIGRLVELPWWLEGAAMLLIADATLAWSATAFPDVLLASALMGAIVVLFSPRFLEDRRLPILLGVCGGIGYLAKAYGFPFFLLWCPLSLLWLVRDRRRATRAWLLAMVGFAAIAAPWVTVLSVKYGHPTYGLVGAINRWNVGPDPLYAPSMIDPGPGRVTYWETPENRPYRTWSPFDSAASMRHQISYSWRTGKAILQSLGRFDLLGLALPFTLLAPFVAFAFGREEEGRRLAWIAGTVLLFSAPFVLVYFTYRYLEPLLRPLCIVAALRVACLLASRVPFRGSVVLLAGVLVSFLAHLNVPFRPHLVSETGGTPFDDVTVDSCPHREVAATLRELGAKGPVASTLYWGGMYVAYFLDAPFVGAPDAPTVEGCEAQLREHGTGVFLVERGWAHATAFASRPGWTRVSTLTPPTGETIDVYVPAAP